MSSPQPLVGAALIAAAALALVTARRVRHSQPPASLGFLQLVVPPSANDNNTNNDREVVESMIASHPDFPLPGILFRDVFPVFQSPPAFAALVRLFMAHIREQQQQQQLGEMIDVVVGLDARGFLLGPLIAGLLGCAFAPIRKRGKLPGQLVSIEYAKEYGTDAFALPNTAVRAGQRVLVVDDLLATGGTLAAACELVHQVGGTIVECCVIIELSELGGRSVIARAGTHKVWSLFQF